MSKYLRFDATSVTTSARGKYVDVEVNAEFPDEVLNYFDAEEIVQHYSDLKWLYNELKEMFE